MHDQPTQLVTDIRRLADMAWSPSTRRRGLGQQQMFFFLVVVKHLAKGERVSMARLHSLYPSLGRAIVKSYVAFLEKTRKVPWGLAWLTLAQDPMDRRVKYFALTPAGAEVVEELVGTTMRGRLVRSPEKIEGLTDRAT